MKIIQIDGIKGLITGVFVCACLFAGFVIAPGYVAMLAWNTYLVPLCNFPVLSLFQGTLLWGIIAISYAIVVKNNFALSFKEMPKMNDKDLEALIKKDLSSQFTMMQNLAKKNDKFELSNNKLSKKIELEDKKTTFVSSPIDLKTDKSNDEEEKTTHVK